MTPGNSKKGRRTSSAPPILNNNNNNINNNNNDSNNDDDTLTEESSLNYSSTASNTNAINTTGKRKSARSSKRNSTINKKSKYSDDDYNIPSSIKKNASSSVTRSSSVTNYYSTANILDDSNNSSTTPKKKNKSGTSMYKSNSSVTTATTNNNNIHSLILVSDKRRGVYECDYCRRDISQVPRISCAICPEFDSCLECFPTCIPPQAQDDADNNTATSETANRSDSNDNDGDNDDVSIELMGVDDYTSQGKSKGGVASTSSSSNNKKKIKHNLSHGYRVADSTRYPLFPSWSSSSTTNTDITTTAATTTKTSLIYKGPSDDNKLWTIEEDLRLLESILTMGLGNWVDISDAVGNNKNPRRCMERYFDDYLGRYGHILPKYLWVEKKDSDDNITTTITDNYEQQQEQNQSQNDEDNTSVTSNSTSWSASASKRKKAKRSTSSSSGHHYSNTSDSGGGYNMIKPRRYTRISTDTLSGYDKLWTNPYLPDDGTSVGDNVNRDVQYRAEQSYVKSLSSTTSKSDADKLMQDIINNNSNNNNNNAIIPTVFPPRLEDIRSLPGSELAGYMPRRGDFDVEWDNDAETILADMEFSTNDHPNERQLKIENLLIYNSKLDERERRKHFIKERDLLNYRQKQLDERNNSKNNKDNAYSRDEKDLLHRMRLFARFHTPTEHEHFCKQILEAKRLRKEIAQLQLYYSLGFSTLSQIEQYEIDRNNRDFHKQQFIKKEKSEKGSSKTKIQQVATTTSTKNVSSNKNSGNDTTNKITPDMEGYNLLSTKEISLCNSLEIVPKVYLQIKRVLIKQSLELTKNNNNGNSNSKILMQLDIKKRGQVIDFVFKAGWIRTKPTFVDG